VELGDFNGLPFSLQLSGSREVYLQARNGALWDGAHINRKGAHRGRLTGEVEPLDSNQLGFGLAGPNSIFRKAAERLLVVIEPGIADIEQVEVEPEGASTVDAAAVEFPGANHKRAGRIVQAARNVHFPGAGFEDGAVGAGALTLLGVEAIRIAGDSAKTASEGAPNDVA